MKPNTLFSLFLLLIGSNIYSQTNTKKDNKYFDKVFVHFDVKNEDTSIVEYMSIKNFDAKKTGKKYQYISAYNSSSFEAFEKFKTLTAETFRDRCNSKLIKENLVDSLRNDAFYRPDNFDIVINVQKFILHTIGSGPSLKHVYSLEAKVSMLNKKEQEVFSYVQACSSEPRKISNYTKLANAFSGTYDYSKLDLLHDTIMKQIINTVFNKAHIEELTIQKETAVKAIESKSEIKEVQEEIKKEEAVVEKEPDPVFNSTLLMSAKNQKTTGNLADFLNSVVSVTFGKNTFSGVIISENGYVLTSYYVLDGNEDQNGKVTLADGKVYPTQTHRIHKNGGLLLLKIDASNLVPLILNPANEPKTGAEIYAIGTSVADELGQSIAKGIVSSNRIIEKQQIIQLNAKINSESFGGALLSPKGELYGMLYSKLVGQDVEGIGFAISPKEIIRMLNLEYK